MTKTWRETARPIIAKVLKQTRNLPEKERANALNVAFQFSGHDRDPIIWMDEIEKQTGKQKRKVEKDVNQTEMF